MMNRILGAKPAGALIGLMAAALFALGTAAWADPSMGGHGDKGGYGHGMKGHGMSLMQPHNAAAHFLKMAPLLKLTDAQVQQLTKLRNQYIDNNAKTEDMLKAAYGDLAGVMFGGDIDTAKATALVDNIGKMESQLWHSYLQQLADIQALLTPAQKQALKDMREGHRGMGEGHGDMMERHGDMPMGHGDMKGMKKEM